MAEDSSGNNRRGRWLPQLYYYLVAVIGLVILLIGLIGGLQSMVTAVWPETGDPYYYGQEASFDREGNPIPPSKAEARRFLEKEQTRAWATSIRYLIAALVGAPVFVWHLRQARRKEPEWMGAEPPRAG